ncbi:hypothetical protein [Microbacterium sp. CH1]|uniref:hypothetical protein n=1 Tax=Microbacterium sp. CH1 TaxID=1770208 RepID=UPI000A537D87|nr:hypothetical protein [Microbacterium sp. CH1]
MSTDAARPTLRRTSWPRTGRITSSTAPVAQPTCSTPVAKPIAAAVPAAAPSRTP